MRQKKFGVWDKVNKCWLTGAEALEIYWVDDELQLHIGIKYANLPFFNETAEKFEIVEYTGLKDCKRTKEYPEGQEIYEGDIVKHNGKNYQEPMLVKFIDGGFCIGKDDIGRGIDEFGDYVTIRDAMAQARFQNTTLQLEIIGNIFENKNLLK